MTIKNGFNEARSIAQTLQTLCAILQTLSVEVTINRVYFAENNKEVSINFSVKKNKFLLKVEQQTEPYVYSITETIRHKGQTAIKKHVLNQEGGFMDEIQITGIITK